MRLCAIICEVKKAAILGFFLATACLAIVISGCAGGERSLRTRSLGYYNYLTGAGKMTREDFMSPAARRAMTDEAYRALRRANEELEKARQSMRENSGFTPVEVKIDQIAAKVDGKFGVTSVPYVYQPANLMAQVRWVRVRGKWYLYTGGEVEVEAYGEFPANLVIEIERPQREIPAGESGEGA